MNEFDIETRPGLPEYLRKLADTYPRDIWESHHNYNDLTQFWLSRHIMFRDIIARLQSDTQNYLEADNDGQAKSTLFRMTGFFLHQLHEHHTIEDHHYFPLLIPYDSDLKRGFELLDGDHQALDKNIHDLAQKTNALSEALQSQKDPRPAAQIVLETQQNFEKFLDRHLVDEEELIVPIILEYGSPEIG